MIAGHFCRPVLGLDFKSCEPLDGTSLNPALMAMTKNWHSRTLLNIRYPKTAKLGQIQKYSGDDDIEVL